MAYLNVRTTLAVGLYASYIEVGKLLLIHPLG